MNGPAINRPAAAPGPRPGGLTIIAMTKNGAALARRLAAGLAAGPEPVKLLIDRRFQADGDGSTAFDLPARPVVQQAFRESSGLLLLLSVGAAVRLLAPALASKRTDPAVVCIDDAGRFCVSLLSGHLGGADRLAQRAAAILGATAVITSASHSGGLPAVDLLGREYGWRIAAPPLAVTRASAAIVNGRPVGFCQETGEPGARPELPPHITEFATPESLLTAEWAAALLITDRLIDGIPESSASADTPTATETPASADTPTATETPASAETQAATETPAPVSLDTAAGPEARPVVVYRPRSLVAGMGCRRGVPLAHLEELLTETFRAHRLSTDSLAGIATADLKGDEPGLLQLAERFGVPLRTFSAPQLNAMFAAETAAVTASSIATHPAAAAARRPTPSARAHRLVGVWGVAEPAALLASGAGSMLVTRQATGQATIAIARRNFAAADSDGGLLPEHQ